MNEVPPPIQPTASPVKNSALAIWSLVLGVLAIVLSLFCIGILFAIPGVICGHMAMSRIKKSMGALTGNGLAIAGLATGYVGVGLSLIFIPMMLAIAVPNFVKGRDTAQRNACLNNLRQIDGATQQWALENRKGSNDVPTWNDISPYIKGAPLKCPADGTYTLRSVGEHPECSVPGHELPNADR